MADTNQQERVEVMGRFPSQGHVEDFDRMFEIEHLIEDLQAERDALSYHAKERIDTMRPGSIVISKVDPSRVYDVHVSNHSVTFGVKSVIQPGCRSNNRSRDI